MAESSNLLASGARMSDEPPLAALTPLEDRRQDNKTMER